MQCGSTESQVHSVIHLSHWPRRWTGVSATQSSPPSMSLSILLLTLRANARDLTESVHVLRRRTSGRLPSNVMNTKCWSRRPINRVTTGRLVYHISKQ